MLVSLHLLSEHPPLDHDPLIVAVVGSVSLKTDSCTQHTALAPVIILALRKHLSGDFLSL